MIENPPPPGQASAKLQEVHEVFMKFLEAKISGSDDDLCGVLYGIGKGFVDLTPKLPRWIDSPNTLEAHARYDFSFPNLKTTYQILSSNFYFAPMRKIFLKI